MPTEPTEPERYDIYCWCGHRVIHSPEPEGEWIRLEDYAALQSAHEALNAKLDAMTPKTEPDSAIIERLTL